MVLDATLVASHPSLSTPVSHSNAPQSTREKKEKKKKKGIRVEMAANSLPKPLDACSQGRQYSRTQRFPYPNEQSPDGPESPFFTDQSWDQSWDQGGLGSGLGSGLGLGVLPLAGASERSAFHSISHLFIRLSSPRTDRKCGSGNKTGTKRKRRGRREEGKACSRLAFPQCFAMLYLYFCHASSRTG